MIMHLNDAHVRANIYFTTKDTNKEKSIDAADSKGRPIPKYQMYVFLLTINEQNLTRFPFPKYQMHVFLRTPMRKLWEGFPIAKYQMPTIMEREGFVISLHIDMEPRVGLTIWSFCAVPLKSSNVMRSLANFVFTCCKALNTLATPFM